MKDCKNLIQELKVIVTLMTLMYLNHVGVERGGTLKGCCAAEGPENI